MDFLFDFDLFSAVQFDRVCQHGVLLGELTEGEEKRRKAFFGFAARSGITSLEESGRDAEPFEVGSSCEQ